MSLVRITQQQALDKLKAGEKVHIIKEADLQMSLADWLVWDEDNISMTLISRSGRRRVILK
ncbi:MAG: hypothetical protein KH452_06070 [Clostridiales bacterium]|nr:hypothetical protein [Clostridiales bacterium]